MVWLQVVALLCVSVAVQVRLVLLAWLPLTGKASSAKVTVTLVPQASLNSGVPNAGVAGHSIVASVGQLATTGAVLSITVMVWLQVVALLCASVAVQVRLVLLAWLPLTGRASSAKLTARLLSQASLKEVGRASGRAGESMVASAGS